MKAQLTLSQDLVFECKKRLLTLKQEILNRVRSSAVAYTQDQANRTTTGDEIDQSVAQLEEYNFLVAHDRMRNQLIEIEMALSRIESGTFGVCEETEEPIESERLIAVPWTRLSIEGAEIREAMNRKFAR